MLSRRFLLLVFVLAIGAFLVLYFRGNDPKAPSLSGPRPDSLTVETIGPSVEGRPIEAVSLGTGEDVILVIGGLHTGDENPTAKLAEQLARYFGTHESDVPPEVRLVFIPLANPDGYANEARVNAHDVDLNRNWPTSDWSPNAVHGDAAVSGGSQPLSEPETRALYRFIDGLSPEIVISLHGYGALVEPNDTGHAKELAAVYAKSTGYKLIVDWLYYEITGELIEALNDLQTPAFDVELRDSEGNRFARSLRGVKAVMKAVASEAD